MMNKLVCESLNEFMRKDKNPFLDFLIKSAIENELPRKIIKFINQSKEITTPVDNFLLEHPEFNIERDFYEGRDVIFDNLFDKWGDNLERITLKDIKNEISIIVKDLLEELPEALPEKEEQISAEDFDKFVDTLLNLPREEAFSKLKTFMDEHPYTHEELGELPGRNKYKKSFDKFAKNFGY